MNRLQSDNLNQNLYGLPIPVSGHLEKKHLSPSPKDTDCLKDLVWYWHLSCKFFWELIIDQRSMLPAGWPQATWLSWQEQKEGGSGGDSLCWAPDSGQSPELQDRSWWLKGIPSCSRAAGQPTWESQGGSREWGGGGPARSVNMTGLIFLMEP